MISIIKSLHRLIGQNGIRLVPSILLSMLDSVLNSCMYGVMLFVLIDLSNGQFSAEGLKMCIIAVVIIFTLMPHPPPRRQRLWRRPSPSRRSRPCPPSNRIPF